MKSSKPERAVLRVISIVDTREYEEVSDGVFAPIPGSGREHECDFCGRTHEVHAQVELTDGTSAVIGTGCAGRGWAREMRRGADLAVKIRRTMKALDVLRAKLAVAYTVEREIAALSKPEPVRVAEPSANDPREQWRMGDAHIWCFFDSVERRFFSSERRRGLDDAWLRNRRRERGVVESSALLLRKVDELERVLRRLVRVQ